MIQTTILNARVEFTERPFRTPLRISSGLITGLAEAEAAVTVLADGREATGRGSIYLSDLWAWPDPDLTHGERDAALRDLCRHIAENLPSLCGDEPAHPLELGLRLHNNLCHQADSSTVPSLLARAMCASPFDAAIHDAVGVALDRCAFELYAEPAPLPSADGLFENGSACDAIARLIQCPPRLQFDAWLIVGKDDSLEEDVRPWVRERGYRCFKLKLLGRDNAADVARTVEVFAALKQFGVVSPRLSVDTNEANPDAESVLDYLRRLRQTDGETFEALEYLEQPTARDIVAHPFNWRDVASLKPVLLDEGLTSLDLLATAQAQGWSGLALKTCKGHSFALTAAAWARENGLIITLQDLTNPGLSAIHAALFAAHVPTLNGVELNSPQFTPDANAAWLPRLASLLEPSDGIHRLPSEMPVGLGSTL